MYRRKLSFKPSEIKLEKDHKLKIIIISGLCIAVLILFYFFITSEGKNETISENSKPDQLSKEEISQKVDSIAFTFGIKKEWIKDISNKKENNSGDKLLITKEIHIPNDLPSIQLNLEYSNYFRDRNFKEKITEDPKTKNVIMELYTANVNDAIGKLSGILKFIYDDSLKRKVSEVCIVLDSIDFYPLDNVSGILNSTEEFSLFLPLRNDKSDYQSKILGSERDYLLRFFIGDEKDITSDFKSDMKADVWKAKIRSASVNFQNSGGIFLTGNTQIKEFENEIKKEFFKNNIAVYSDTLLSGFQKSEQTVNSLFSDIITQSNSGKKFLLYSVNLSPEEFKYYDSQLFKLKKLGYKFFNFTDIMKKINNNIYNSTQKDSIKTKKSL